MTANRQDRMLAEEFIRLVGLWFGGGEGVTDVEPCPFCGGPARTFHYDGALQATCAAEYQDCAGAGLHAPVAMWNRRAARGVPIAYLRVYPKDGSRFLAFAAMTGPLPEVETLDNGTIIHNTPLYA